MKVAAPVWKYVLTLLEITAVALSEELLRMLLGTLEASSLEIMWTGKNCKNRSLKYWRKRNFKSYL